MIMPIRSQCLRVKDHPDKAVILFVSYPFLSLFLLYQISPWDLLTSNKQPSQPQMKLLFPTSSAASVILTETFEIHTMPHANPLGAEPLYSTCIPLRLLFSVLVFFIYTFPLNVGHKTILVIKFCTGNNLNKTNFTRRICK